MSLGKQITLNNGLQVSPIARISLRVHEVDPHSVPWKPYRCLGYESTLSAIMLEF